MLEASGWKGRAGTAAGRTRDGAAFVQGAVTALAAEGQARIDRLSSTARPIAATITLRAGDCAWFWKIAYDEDARAPRPACSSRSI